MGNAEQEQERHAVRQISQQVRRNETNRDKDENDNEEDQLGDWVAEIIGIDFKSKKEGAYPKGYYLLTEQQSGYGRPWPAASRTQ